MGTCMAESVVSGASSQCTISDLLPQEQFLPGLDNAGVDSWCHFFPSV